MSAGAHTSKFHARVERRKALFCSVLLEFGPVPTSPTPLYQCSESYSVISRLRGFLTIISHNSHHSSDFLRNFGYH